MSGKNLSHYCSEFIYKLKKNNSMKLKVLTISLLLSAILFNAGCTKDETAEPAATSLNAGQCQISCSVSGAVSSTFSSVLMISQAAKSTEIMNLSGSAVSGMNPEIAMLLLPSNVAPGTYSYSSGLSTFEFSYSNGSNGWATDAGQVFTIMVSKATATEIEGTFSGVLKNDELNTTVSLSNGKFAAKF
jgi:hypothetical protein